MEPLDILKFNNWISVREFENPSWISVFRIIKLPGMNLNTISVLAKKDSDEIYEKILDSSEWNTRFNFGEPYFYYGEDGEDKINVFGNEELYGIEFEPFVFYRTFHGLYLPEIEIIQNFINFYNLYFVKNENTFKALDNEMEEHNVLQIKKEEKHMEIKVNTRYLRNYLTAREMILIRNHDHRRFSKEMINSLKEEERLDFSYTEPLNYNFSVWVKNHKSFTEMNSMSRLLGKDIIKPYKKINHSLIWFSDGFWEPIKQFCNFIIGIDENGENIKETCNEAELSNYYADTGKPHFLTPVFFDRKVLKKYYDLPSKYFVGARSVSCLNYWVLPTDENKKGLIYAWLGDLGRIPFKEQQHWRQYNVLPEGGITEHIIKTDFLAEPADTDAPMFLFWKAYNRANEHCSNNHDFSLFKELSNSDSHCCDSLHVPVSNEQMEFDEMILYLAKVLNDSLNKSELDKILGSKEDASINSLENFIKSKINEQDAIDIVKPFRIIQSLRSSGSAHIKGKGYFKNISKADLEKLSNIKRFIVILENITDSLERLALI